MTKYLSILVFHLPLVLFGQTKFIDQTAEAGLSHIGTNRGASVADFDNDGWEDIFTLTHSENCRLYHNNGDGTYTEIAEEAGVDYVGFASASAWADIDNDGWLDLMVGDREGDNVLYHNNGDGTFTDITAEAGVAEGGKVVGILFSDVNMDGFVDIYVVRFFKENIMYMNNGDGTFTDKSDWANADDDGLSMGALFFDYDHDGDPDLYLTRDGSQTFILYSNLGNGKFIDVSLQSGTNIEAMGMGVDVGDVNNDGWLDIYVTNLGQNTLLLNDGDDGFFGPAFSDVALEAGVGDAGMGWGTIFLDSNNDGWQDIYLANDSHYSPMPNMLYLNNGDNTFLAAGEEGDEASMEPSYGVVTTDANNDGLVDIFITNSGSDIGNQLFINTTENENNWVKINAIGTESNRAAIGAKVTIEFDGNIQSDEIISGNSYASQNSLLLHFGLGQSEIIDKVSIRWPSGLEEIYEQLNVNTKHILVEGEGLFSDLSNDFSGEEIEIHPNPFTDYLTLYASKLNEFNVEIFDPLGQKIFHEKINQTNGSQTIDLFGVKLVSGVYYLKVNCAEGVRTFKVIKS